MISSRVRDAFELFANSKVKLISKQVGVEQALANVIVAAEQLKRGTCFCDVAIGHPLMTSHSKKCSEMTEALSALDVALRECGE